MQRVSKSSPTGDSGSSSQDSSKMASCTLFFAFVAASNVTVMIAFEIYVGTYLCWNYIHPSISTPFENPNCNQVLKTLLKVKGISNDLIVLDDHQRKYSGLLIVVVRYLHQIWIDGLLIQKEKLFKKRASMLKLSSPRRNFGDDH